MIIKDVTSIESNVGGDLVLKTSSGVDITINTGNSPGYINIGTILRDDQLEIVVFITWDV